MATQEGTVSFTVERETKNTVRFNETANTLGVDQVIGVLYVQKAALDALPDWDTETLTVRLEA